MKLIDWLIFAIINALFTSIVVYFNRKSSNQADKEDNRDLHYEAEKGKNIATKEDIAEITKNIEEVKNAVSFQNQWEHDHILQREQRLIHILYIAQKISVSYNHILLMGRNPKQVHKLLNLVETLNIDMLEIIQEGNLLLVDNHTHQDISPATKLIDTAVLYAAELATIANNVSVKILGAEDLKNRSFEINDQSAHNMMITSNSMLQEAVKMCENSPKMKEQTAQAINEYIIWLEKLYGKGVLIKYNIQEESDNK